jgi:hypothetical protein
VADLPGGGSPHYLPTTSLCQGGVYSSSRWVTLFIPFVGMRIAAGTAAGLSSRKNRDCIQVAQADIKRTPVRRKPETGWGRRSGDILQLLGSNRMLLTTVSSAVRIKETVSRPALAT